MKTSIFKYAAIEYLMIKTGKTKMFNIISGKFVFLPDKSSCQGSGGYFPLLPDPFRLSFPRKPCRPGPKHPVHINTMFELKPGLRCREYIMYTVKSPQVNNCL